MKAGINEHEYHESLLQPRRLEFGARTVVMQHYSQELLKKYPIISDQVDAKELSVLLHELEKVLAQGASGAIVEFGCYVGTTSLFIRRLMDHYGASGEFHVYDSFQGLPPKTLVDESRVGEQFVEGELRASKKTLLQGFKKAGLTPPFVHKAWFSDLAASDVPGNINFAFLDGDYYDSIKDSLKLVWPNLAHGAVVVVDDYANEALPGAARAVDEWLLSHKPARFQVIASLAVITVK